MKQFIIDLIKRFTAKTPKFFKIVRTLGIVIAIVTGLPKLLENSGVILPEAIQVITSKVISIAATIGVIIAQLTVVPEEQFDLKIK